MTSDRDVSTQLFTFESYIYGQLNYWSKYLLLSTSNFTTHMHKLSNEMRFEKKLLIQLLTMLMYP